MTLNYHGNGLMVNSIGTRQNKDVPNVQAVQLLAPFNRYHQQISLRWLPCGGAAQHAAPQHAAPLHLARLTGCLIIDRHAH